MLYLFLDPPNNKQAMAFLMSKLPKMEGAMLLETVSYTLGLAARWRNWSSSAGEIASPVLLPGPLVSTDIPSTRRYGCLIPTFTLSLPPFCKQKLKLNHISTVT